MPPFPFFCMDDFLSYLTDEHIVERLCKEAGKYVFKPKKTEMPLWLRMLFSLLPPRLLWAELKKNKCNDSKTQKKAVERLQQIVMRHLKHRSHYPYLVHLRRFMDSLRSIAMQPDSYTFPKPVVKAQVKKQKGDVTICRPTSAYDNLEAKILIGLMADYLKSWLDPMLHYTNLAYRAPREWEGQANVATKNEHAIALLLKWRKEHNGQPIYIAECDIQKFFDTIDHDDAIAALRMMMARDGRKDENFCQLFEHFVCSFDFQNDVMSCNGNQDYWRSQFGERAAQHTYRFEWIKDAPDHPIGIPQGAALSPIIANLLMNVIDEQTLGDKLVDGRITDSNLYYARYCDDVLIAHTSLRTCASIMYSYRAILNQHQLRYHHPESVLSMKDGVRLQKEANACLFWEAKTKLPYRWGKGAGNASKWIGFLGYEISRYGEVRLRKSSVAKQAEKIVNEVEKIRYEQTSKAEKIAQFERRKIGGSKIDSFVNLITDDTPYRLQRDKLEKLKARKLRKLLAKCK